MLWIHRWFRLAAFSPRGGDPRQPSAPARRYRPRIEGLEQRWLPSTVTTLADSGPGSLREAIAITAQNGTVDFAPGLAGTIALTSGALRLASNLTITGPGASLILVSGNQRSQVFVVSPNVTDAISGLTVTKGFGSSNGGGILNEGNLTLTDCIISGNATIDIPGHPHSGTGGGISNSGILKLTRCVVSGNATLTFNFVGNDGGKGGGIYNTNVLTVDQSIVSWNSTFFNNGSGGWGGGIYTDGGTMTLINTSVFENVALGQHEESDSGRGGGIYIAGGTETLLNCTVVGNRAVRGDPPPFQPPYGGGILIASNASVTLRNTLVAQNSGAPGPDISGPVAIADHNLIGNGDGSSGLIDGTNGNRVGSSSNLLDPRLGALQNNGGPTPTLALLPGSPAIDAGTNQGAPDTDQRGFHRTVNGTTDIGAFEYQPPATTTTLWGSAPNPSRLGEAVAFVAMVSGNAANSNTPAGTVTFLSDGIPMGDASLSGGRASFMTRGLTGGRHIITARFNGFTLGDSHFDSSTSDRRAQDVQPANSSTALDAMPNPSTQGEAVTYTATVSGSGTSSFSPSGAVTFFADGTPLGDGLLNSGKATFTTRGLTIGSHRIVAHYRGDANFNPDDSPPLTQVVAASVPTFVQLDVSPNLPRTNQPITFRALVTATELSSHKLTGTVTFFDGDSPVGTVSLSDGLAVLTTRALAGGNRRYVAVYSGDVHFLGGRSESVSHIVRLPGFFAIGGAPGRVRIYRFDGSLAADFAPYGPAYTGGVSVAVGDINGDGFPDLITGAANGSPHVKVYDGQTFAQGTFNANPEGHMLASFFAYGVDFHTGVNVAAGDISGDGIADIVTGAAAGNPHVKVFRGQAIATGAFDAAQPDASLRASFFAYGLQFNVGATVAVGDVNADGFADIVTGASTGNPHVKVYNGQTIARGTFQNANPDASLLASFFAFGQYHGGVNVAVGPVAGGPYADIITGAAVGNPDVRVYSGQAIGKGAFDSGHPEASSIDQFFAYELQFNIGVTVAAVDIQGTGRAAILTGASQGAPHYRVVQGDSTGIQPLALNGIEGLPNDLQGGISVGA